MAGPADAVEFVSVTPTERDYLRGIVLFGRNVASYKFALAKSLIELAGDDRTHIALPDLAVPFSRHLCEHLATAPKQATSPSSRFLDTCRSYNAGDLDEDELITATAKLGFVNVIDAFHTVGRDEVPVRFFEDNRRGTPPGIVLTDAAFEIAKVSGDALAETEARWRLVETAWSLELSDHLVAYDGPSGILLLGRRRRPVTGARAALNGYQKGKCFYCYRPIEVTAGSPLLGEVDHVFPETLQRKALLSGVDRVWNLDGIWNLVLACGSCNGPASKWFSAPHRTYVARLHKRNEYLITSHDPLREPLLNQTGATPAVRRAHLQRALDVASRYLPGPWSTPPLGDPTF